MEDSIYPTREGYCTVWRLRSNNEIHRLDGPAIEWNDGIVEYWLNGKLHSIEEWDRLRKLLWLA